MLVLGHAVTHYQPATEKTDAIIRPKCPKCRDHRVKMLLARIEPEKAGYELHVFEYPECGYSISVVAAIE
jgi:hypothetical protein